MVVLINYLNTLWKIQKLLHRYFSYEIIRLFYEDREDYFNEILLVIGEKLLEIVQKHLPTAFLQNLKTNININIDALTTLLYITSTIDGVIYLKLYRRFLLLKDNYGVKETKKLKYELENLIIQLGGEKIKTNSFGYTYVINNYKDLPITNDPRIITTLF